MPYSLKRGVGVFPVDRARGRVQPGRPWADRITRAVPAEINVYNIILICKKIPTREERCFPYFVKRWIPGVDGITQL
jgi:hypothetical protein